MSAFVVGTRHIDYLLSWAFHLARNGVNLSWERPDTGQGLPIESRRERFTGEPENVDAIGNMLLKANLLSVSYRYGEPPAGLPAYAFREVSLTKLSAAQALKAIACLEYQSCEHNGWETSQAQSFLASLARGSFSRVRGYDEAAWEVRDEDVKTNAVSIFDIGKRASEAERKPGGERFACPDGAECKDPACRHENQRRGVV